MLMLGDVTPGLEKGVCRSHADLLSVKEFIYCQLLPLQHCRCHKHTTNSTLQQILLKLLLLSSTDSVELEGVGKLKQQSLECLEPIGWGINSLEASRLAAL